MSGFLSAVRDELPNKEFREDYVAENVRRGLAYQIRALREARGWSPAEFARQAGLPQSNISRWENPTYGKFNLSTLIEIASVFDVALSVRFVGFEELLISLADLRPQTLVVPSYEQEQENVAKRDDAVQDALRRFLAPSPRSSSSENAKRAVGRLEDEPPKPIEYQHSDDETLLGKNLNPLIEKDRNEQRQPGQLGDEGARVTWM
jgi:transcriptional regulator with XRE-family HTH domain